MGSAIQWRSMDRTTGWGRKPHLIQYLLWMIGVSAEEDSSKIGNNEIATIAGAAMVPWVVPCITYAYPIIALFQPTQAKGQRVVWEILTIPPSQLAISSSFCVYTFPDWRCAESALSAVCFLGEPLLPCVVTARRFDIADLNEYTSTRPLEMNQ